MPCPVRMGSQSMDENDSVHVRSGPRIIECYNLLETGLKARCFLSIPDVRFFFHNIVSACT